MSKLDHSSKEALKASILSALAVEFSDDKEFLKKLNNFTFGFIKDDLMQERGFRG